MNKQKTLSDIRLFCFNKCNPITEIGLWCSNSIVDQDNQTAATNGRTIFFFNDFFNRPFREQAFIYLHEVLHVAFRHSERAKDLCHTASDRDLFNIAADCIINQALISFNWADTPKDCYTFNSLPQEVKSKLTKEHSSYSAEEIFRILKESNFQSDEDFIKDLISGSEAAKFSPDSTEGASGGTGDSMDEQIETITAIDKITSALFGSDAGSLFAELKSDLPKIKTPWHRILNQFLQTCLSPKSRANWTYPSRLTLSGVVSVFLPAVQKEKELPTIYIAYDVSGSCFSESNLKKFTANVWSIKEKTGADLVVITFDTKIRQTFKIKDKNSFRKSFFSTRIEGGGGTSFRPLFDQKKNASKPTVMVVLTDLYGDFPDKTPDFPVIWAVNHAAKVDTPFGKIIRLD